MVYLVKLSNTIMILNTNRSTLIFHVCQLFKNITCKLTLNFKQMFVIKKLY